MKHPIHWCSAAVLVALLSGCGGGGDNWTATPPAPEPTVPASLADNVESFVAYLTALVNDDFAEPLSLGSVVPAATEE